MTIGFYDILKILGALGLFMYGMKVMSDGIQKAAGGELRKVLRSITTNRFVGLFTGFFTTATVQSSSATTVLIVSFVNAGLITLVESTGVIIGANIGTTITSWLVSIIGFQINLSSFSLPLLLLGIPMFFSNRDRLKFWGEFIIGFCLLFLGLEFLKTTVPDIENNPGVLQWLQNFTQYGFLSNLIFVIAGIILTVIIQSSSALIALVLAMCFNGWIPFNLAAAAILGANIGTCITAEVAALVGNIHAKRSARIHTLFNVLGVLWMLIFLPVVLLFISKSTQNIFAVGDPFTNNEALPIALSLFHTVFNILNGILFLILMPYLIKLAKITLPSKEEEENLFRLKYIHSANLTPELSIIEANKEMQKYAKFTERMMEFTSILFFDTDEKQRRKMIKKIKKYERISDRIESELNEYLISLAKQPISSKLLFRVKSMLNACYELERIGDLFNQIGKTVSQKIENKVWFSPKQTEELKKMCDLVKLSFEQLHKNLALQQKTDHNFEEARELKTQIKILVKDMKQDGEEIDDETNLQSLIIFNNITNLIGEIGELLFSISRSLYPENAIKI